MKWFLISGVSIEGKRSNRIHQGGYLGNRITEAKINKIDRKHLREFGMKWVLMNRREPSDHMAVGRETPPWQIK